MRSLLDGHVCTTPGQWFEWFDDAFARSESDVLTTTRNVRMLGDEQGESPLPESESFDPPEPVLLVYPRKGSPTTCAHGHPVARSVNAASGTPAAQSDSMRVAS